MSRLEVSMAQPVSPAWQTQSNYSSSMLGPARPLGTAMNSINVIPTCTSLAQMTIGKSQHLQVLKKATDKDSFLRRLKARITPLERYLSPKCFDRANAPIISNRCFPDRLELNGHISAKHGLTNFGGIHSLRTYC